MHFSEKIRALQVAPETVAIAWLGQAGFVIKTAAQEIIVVDPYLTDYAYDVLKESFGLAFKRVSAPLCEPSELPFDVMLISHEHADHLDMYAMDAFLKAEKGKIYMTEPCAACLEAGKMDTSRVVRIGKGDRFRVGTVSVEVLDCDHGADAPLAVGFLLDFGFTSVYYAGDTALNPARLRAAIKARPKAALLPINGTFGNMNASEAFALAELLQCQYCVPYHFWTFPGQQGDPVQIIRAFQESKTPCRLSLLTPGEILVVGRE